MKHNLIYPDFVTANGTHILTSRDSCASALIAAALSASCCASGNTFSAANMFYLKNARLI